ncbi:metal-dependent hydrolase [Oleomonas cavernae]|uniref:Metal-dependent hydrolase n=1 Tax=Oleomonas cavernae TaxID=2320859 RepID=A0A418WSZ4_9PROT|nr:metal-dependent hydrolase [Oleomonas cavernae]RJF94374.1 metal-dependent hydrolase [Oleomonas cavernae]
MATAVQASTATWEIRARRVAFDWTNPPLRWLPEDPFGAHWVNQFSFTLVKGEGFFCRTFTQALPRIGDAKLRQDVETFIRQEAIHAGAHKVSIEEYLSRYGTDIADNYRRSARLFERTLAEKPLGIRLPAFMQRRWLLVRVGLVAAAEHFTCALGQFALKQANWKAGGDPVVTDLFTWHCAEEVEHRTVAYDLYRHLGGGYLLRAALMAITGPVLVYLMAAGTARFARTDEGLPRSQKSLFRRGFWQAWRRSARLDNIPSVGWFATTALRFFKPGYHPLHEGSTELALAYINQSPGVAAYEAATARRAS